LVDRSSAPPVETGPDVPIVKELLHPTHGTSSVS
jgi:hypothetical protein